MQKEDIKNSYQDIQSQICKEIAQLDGKADFTVDNWQRKEGGGGSSRVLINGNIWEKAGVNFSEVFGSLPENIRTALGVEGTEFYATGVSIVMHPHSPLLPIIHMNIRYFEIADETWWFGGGMDLTPHYINKEEAQIFHRALKTTCDNYDHTFYPRFKKWADDYFFIPHRNETRGVGGIFYDRLNEASGHSKKTLFDFSCDLGMLFPKIYSELILRSKDKPFGQAHKNWQMLRRGRYVEFNLVYDKGTKFGLYTSGRIESILMSLPYRAGWEYDYQPKPNSEEAQTLSLLKKDIDWAND